MPVSEAYDENGQLEMKDYLNEDGIPVSETYENGQLIRRTIDHPNGAITESYDEKGMLSYKHYNNEEGKCVSDSYKDGKIESRHILEKSLEIQDIYIPSIKKTV